MTARSEVSRGRARVHAALVSLGLLAALFLLAPRDLHGAKSFKECIDGTFADYNSCLMESTSWFNRKLCDISWEFEVAVCAAQKVGDVINGYEDGSPK